jgi:hypothetical protein
MRKLRISRLGISLFLSLATVTLVGCATVKLIGDYDEQIDQGVTALQRETETFLVKLESVPGAKLDAYERNKAFYGEAKVATSSLRVRADAAQRNSLTVRMLDKLQNNLNRFEAAHKEGIDKKEMADYRGGFNSQFTAILTLELAKKRGETPDETKASAGATPVTAQPGSAQ